MRREARKVWMVVSPGAELLDLSGPWSVLGQANEIIGRPVYDLRLVTPARGLIPTRFGLVLHGATPLARAARQGLPDTLIVTGGSGLPQLPAPHAALARWLRAHHREIPRVVSICGGAWVLAAAGLLDGKRATTHWRVTEALQQRYPRVQVVGDEIFVRDGRVWTSAGISTGIDLTLALVEQDHGHAVAMAVAKNLVLFLRRSGSQAQFSEPLKRQEREPGRLRDVSTFVVEHLDRPLGVPELAKGLGMSARSLTRWCQVELGESPAALVRRVRLEEAQRLLAETPLPLKDVANRAGLGDASTLWRVFTRGLGVTPARYRDRFATGSMHALARRSPSYPS